MLATAGPDHAGLRAFIRVGGISVARQQLALALALGCDRVICLAPGMGTDMAALQHAAETGGAQFHLIIGPRALHGLVTAADDLIVLADGLFAAQADAAALLEQGPGVLVQPVEIGLALGFERIDAVHAGAGAMRIPGRLVEQMAALPADCDVASALQRIALQAGLRQRPLPVSEGAQPGWVLIRDEADAHAIEPQWIRLRTGDQAHGSPTRLIALAAVRRLGAGLLHAGGGSRRLLAAAGLATLMALGAGWLGAATAGLAVVVIAALIKEIAVVLRRIEADSLSRGDGDALVGGFDWVFDAIIVVLAGWAAAEAGLTGTGAQFFAPAMLVAVLRILARALPARWGAWCDDRAVLAAALAVLIGTGAGAPGVQLAAVAAGLAGTLALRLRNRLTPP